MLNEVKSAFGGKTLIKLLLLAAVVMTVSQTTKVYSQESLYKRLGGYDAIAAVSDDFIGRLVGSHTFTKFFEGASNDSKMKIRQHVVDFICMNTGGPCYYTGRDMKTSHKGLGITEKDWNEAAGLLVESLKKFNVPQKEMDELLAIVNSIKGDIVEKP